MGISINSKALLVDLISIARPHQQRLPGRQVLDTIDYSISSVSVDAKLVQRDLTLVNTEAAIESIRLPVSQVLLSDASLHRP